jgi:hypothetical protein
MDFKIRLVVLELQPANPEPFVSQQPQSKWIDVTASVFVLEEADKDKNDLRVLDSSCRFDLTLWEM